MSATQFKARCLAVLDDVADGAGPVVVTKHGKPVARLVPIEGPAELAGSVRFLVDDDTLIQEPRETWNAEP